MRIQRGRASGGNGRAPEPAQDADAAQLYPALVEFLTVLEWEPGEPRIPGTLLVCSQDGRWRLWLNDRDASRSCWFSGSSVVECLQAAEYALEQDSAEWRSDQSRTKRR